ncbi:hypothetical protein ABT160_34705 [Streptomyces sp. NPDC001941]|uniref:hypothetical protein n=1 Tax=Streptomyces sp. NPDC001941 TaxID=3154659 RepID=UPI00331CC990
MNESPDVVEEGSLGAREVRLRPGVAVTPLRSGLHLRGRDGSVTLEGSSALPALWPLLAARLAPGTAARPGPGPALDPADPRVGSALDTLAEQLRVHGLLTEYPGEAAGTPADWLGAGAEQPGPAAAALAVARVSVESPDPAGALASALLRALERSGVPAGPVAAEGLPPGRALVVASTALPGDAVAVAVSVGADGGFVTAPGAPEAVREQADAVALRLGTVAGDGGAGSLVALLAGAAAQRLVCAAAGLPDPAVRGDDPRLLPYAPAVLVADARPARAAYHSWVSTPVPAPGAAADLAEALRRVEALGDARLGVLDAPLPGALPQLPAALALCATPEGPLAGGAPRSDLARLTTALRAAEVTLGPGVLVGVDADHALGRLLRREALRLPAAPDPGPVLPAAHWLGHPQARHWWQVLIEHLGQSEAIMTVRQLGCSGVHVAVVRESGPRTEPVGAVLGEAVEATASDAAALAALAAVTRVMGGRHAPEGALHTAFSGAEAPLAAAGAVPAPWADEGWTDRWLAAVAAREPGLRTALARLTGARGMPWRPGPDGTSGRLATALETCGFTVLTRAADPDRPADHTLAGGAR